MSYNRRAVPLTVIRALEPAVNNYMFDPTEIAKVSRAAAVLCVWVKDILGGYFTQPDPVIETPPEVCVYC